jgi:mannose-6-phosphate isomerase-like protein (cupin superfamily)
MNYVFRKKDVFSAEMKDPDRTAYVWVDGEQGAKNISAGSADIPVNGGLPYHIHDKEEEVMFVYKGTGVLIVEGESIPLEPETMVFMPPGLEHQFKNTGSEPLSFVWFYAPPGPEQKVRMMGKRK